MHSSRARLVASFGHVPDLPESSSSTVLRDRLGVAHVVRRTSSADVFATRRLKEGERVVKCDSRARVTAALGLEAWGYREDELLGADVAVLAAQPVRDAHPQHMRAVAESWRSACTPVLVRTATAGLVACVKYTQRDDDQGYQATFVEASELSAVFWLDAEGEHVYGNAAFRALVGRTSLPCAAADVLPHERPQASATGPQQVFVQRPHSASCSLWVTRHAATASGPVRWTVCRGPEGAASASVGLPRRAGAVVLERVVGTGISATVYAGRRGGDAQPVAVKVIDKRCTWLGPKGNSGAIDREVHLHRRCSAHPCVVALLEVVESEHEVWLVLELLSRTLKAHVVELEVLTRHHALSLLLPVADALQWMHAHELVHLDVKCENVLLTADGSSSKLCDFGVAAEAAPLARVLKEGVGTVFYCAPEIYACYEMGDDATFAGGPADVWSLAVCLYYCLTGDNDADLALWCKRDGAVADFLATQALLDPSTRALLSAVLCEAPTDRPAMAQLLARLRALGRD